MNDGLALAPLGRVERGDGVVEDRDGSDVGAKAPVPHPVNDLHQLTRNGLDDEVDREAVDRASLGRPDHRHQRPARSDDARRAPLDVTADDIEDQVDPADVFEILVVEVEELVRAELKRRLAVRRPAGTDDVGAELPASWVTTDPTAPAAPWARTLCPA